MRVPSIGGAGTSFLLGGQPSVGRAAFASVTTVDNSPSHMENFCVSELLYEILRNSDALSMILYIIPTSTGSPNSCCACIYSDYSMVLSLNCTCCLSWAPSYSSKIYSGYLSMWIASMRTEYIHLKYSSWWVVRESTTCARVYIICAPNLGGY